MPHDLFLNGPEPPRPPYQIPESKETTRLAGRWKALSRKVKIGVVAGGLLSLVAVGAMANPLTSTPSPQVPKFDSASVSAPARPTTAASTMKAVTTKPATTAPTAASVSAPATTAAPPTTAAVAPTTKAATTAKTTAAAPKTTAATKTTAAARTTTAAAAKATVTPGAFCSGAGTTGVTSTGKAMVCKTSATDTRLRWRAA